MTILILFLEGMITFVSPCLLPMLPLYIGYFAGQEVHGSRWILLRNVLGFVLGFTLVFVVLGAFAGTLGGLVLRYRRTVNLVAGGVVILFGLNYLGVLRIGILNRVHKLNVQHREPGFFSSIVFGLVFSLGWTPCVGAFLGSALLLAATGGSSLSGALMLLAYSLGLAVPFVASAMLLDRFKGAFDLLRSHQRTLHLVSGGLLVLLGFLMATGVLARFLEQLAF